jgi:outer membrane protein TolC
LNGAGYAARPLKRLSEVLIWVAGLFALDASIGQPVHPALEVGEVLASSAAHYPAILESIALRRAAEGKLLEADGAFDIVFAADGSNRLSGYYDGSAIAGGVKRSIPALGTSMYAGYRVSNGEFPIYEDANYTNEYGEIKLGVLFSMLRDRQIDSRRFQQMDARLEIREAELDILLTQIGVQRRALIAYWRWVTAGRTLEVYENLLAIALDRTAALEQQVQRGAQAEIFLIENQQNITRRETFVTSARRDFRLASNELSLYYRTADGLPLAPPPERLPPTPSLGTLDELSLQDPGDVMAALARRPELALLRTAFERAQNRIALAANSLKPRVDLKLELARDFGALAEGGPSRDGTDAIVGVTFSVPLQQRTARGRLRQEQAQINAIQQQQRLREDQMVVELENIVLNLSVAEDLLRLAAEQVEQSELVRDAEQRRFDSGASDFFVLNVREESAANALIQYYSSDLERHVARANYDASVVDSKRLGLETSELPH